jgi:hypothetical protein
VKRNVGAIYAGQPKGVVTMDIHDIDPARLPGGFAPAPTAFVELTRWQRPRVWYPAGAPPRDYSELRFPRGHKEALEGGFDEIGRVDLKDAADRPLELFPGEAELGFVADDEEARAVLARLHEEATSGAAKIKDLSEEPVLHALVREDGSDDGR